MISQVSSVISSNTLLVTLTVVTSTVLYYWIRTKTKNNFVNLTKVKKLFIYPVKALKGVEVDSLEITENVVKYGKFKDR